MNNIRYQYNVKKLAQKRIFSFYNNVERNIQTLILKKMREKKFSKCLQFYF